MKLNFWQILGIVLVIGGAIGVIFFNEKKADTTDKTPTSQPTSQPAVLPVTPSAS